MVKKLYAVKDHKIGFNGGVFHADNDDVAVRDLSIAVNSPSGLLHSNPEDFSLYFVGEFDNDSGIITPTDTPILVANCVDLKKVEVE